MPEDDGDAAGASVGSTSSGSTVRKKGFLSRIWNAIFRGRGDDFEKKLEYLSKEEASVHSRMKKRAHKWRTTARNIVLFTVTLEVVAIAYAFIATRTPDLSWQRRARHVFPMFALPALSFGFYYVLGSLTRLLDQKDQKTLERLRTERQAKIDELKERTNFYATQQLIQRYDLDPAAKAAAATVLASKLGAETGLKVYVGDNSQVGPAPNQQTDHGVSQSDGLRNRKHPHRNIQRTGSSAMSSEITHNDPSFLEPDTETITRTQSQVFVEHHPSSGASNGGWVPWFAALLVGEHPSQCYALICGNCMMHNGLVRKEDFSQIRYFCPHCKAFNGPKQEDESVPGLSSGVMPPLMSANDGNSASEAEAEGASEAAREKPDQISGGALQSQE
ncbi:uncharacterized protein At2g24330-like [Wolffia australiana]